MATSLKRGLEEQVVDEQGVKKLKAEGEAKPEGELLESRLLIDNYEASVIIGKGGENVKVVRTDSGAFVSILKTESAVSKERVMTIKGTPDAIAKAIMLIVNLLLESANSRKQKDPTAATGELETSYTVKILIHKFLAGSIIGKGGTIIKEIQEQSGAKVQLSNDPLTNSTEKTVTVTGTAEQVNSAASRIMTQLHENPLRQGCTSIPYVPGQAAAAAGASPYGAPAAPYGAPPGAYGYPPQPGYGAPYGAPAAAPAAAGPSKVEKIVIPTVCAGTVIGKGGSIIRDIKTQSGCAITIADPQPTTPADRVVAITGSAQGISTAIYLIRQRVESYQPPPAQA